jgi:hypothetical protein
MSFDITAKNWSVLSYKLNNSQWSRLAEKCVAVAPELMSKIKHLYTNDGDGLNDEDAKALATKLIEGLQNKTITDIGDGWVEAFAVFLNECGGFELW